MIFSESKMESYKERNLYYKFFAGYFLNELIDDENDRYEDRVNNFNKILTKGLNNWWEESSNSLEMGKLDLKNIHVSFDNHAIQYDPEADRGEFADIFIVDKTNNVFIAIEVKFLSNINFVKDVENQQKRFKKVMGCFMEKPNPKVYQFLLLKKEKWENIQKRKFDGSTYNQLLRHVNPNKKKNGTSPDCHLGIICWEDFLGKDSKKQAELYLESMLKKKDWANNCKEK